MYLHLGGDALANSREVVGIFDLDTTTVSKRSREMLAAAEQAKTVVNVSYELPKSFVVTAKPQRRALVARGRARPEQTLYISQLSAATLKKRAEAQQRNKQYIKL